MAATSQAEILISCSLFVVPMSQGVSFGAATDVSWPMANLGWPAADGGSPVANTQWPAPGVIGPQGPWVKKESSLPHKIAERPEGHKWHLLFVGTARVSGRTRSPQQIRWRGPVALQLSKVLAPG